MAESHFDRRRREGMAFVRARRAGWRGMPAVLVVVSGFALLTLAWHRQQDGEIRQRYLNAAQRAAELEKWALVETLGRKLAYLRPFDPVGQYYVALSADAEGHTGRATRLMAQIAPRDQLGFAPAHWWFVQTLTADHRDLNDAEVLEVRDHLQQFLKIEGRHPEAHVLLSQIELARGEVDEAVRLMVVAGDLSPALKLAAARFASRLGRSAAARSQAEQAARYYRLWVDEHPGDVEARLNWADTLSMLGQPEQAARVLAIGINLTDDQRLRAGFVRLCNSTFDLLQDSGAATDDVLRKQLSLLRQSLRLEPTSTSVLKRVAQLANRRTTEGREAALLLEPYLTDETAPAVVHLVLGTDAVTQKDYESAQRHFARAHQLDPAFPACINNLAWTLAQGDRPDLQRALSLANQATNQEPDRPEFHETRGEILVKLGRYQEAVPELKQGLRTPGDVSATHAYLAEAYDALGQSTQASHHRRQGRREFTAP